MAKTVTKQKQVQNINIKAQFESPKRLHQTLFETSKHLQQTGYSEAVFLVVCDPSMNEL